MHVRPAIAEDVTAILAIMAECDLAADDVDYSKWDGIVLVAVRQSEVVGFIHAIPSRPYAIITHIAVRPAHQRGRAGIKLIEGAELLLRAAGITNWFTFAWEKDTQVRDLVKHWGAAELPVGHLLKRIM